MLGPSLTAPYLCLAVYGFDFAKHISLFMQLVVRTSPMRCGLVALIIMTFGYGRNPMRCDDAYCHYNDPAQILHFLDIFNGQIYIEMACLVGIIIFYRVLAYLSIKRRFAT